ncbi:MAG: NTP transferase domain-containing protein [Nitrospirae bacterium]|nr:NTP transferase domain-containing protein [Nitrospirota bacterium]
MSESGEAAASSWVRCGIILAAGDGTRLRPMVRRLRGDALPKQYVRFDGRSSMLEQAVGRAATLIPEERLFTVVGRHHLAHRDAREQLDRCGGPVVVQPANKETAPGLLLPLMHLYKRYPEAVVAVFPSDHSISDDGLFMSYVDRACHVVEQHPWLVVQLGVEPGGPEPEYGYILPGGVITRDDGFEVRAVVGFVEKPDARTAESLALQGGVWNTMVMVFRAKTWLCLIGAALPELYEAFGRIYRAIGTRDEAQVVEEVYSTIPPVNLSAGFLSCLAATSLSPLAVLPVRGVTWSDWGSERRIMEGLGRRPAEELPASAGN